MSGTTRGVLAAHLDRRVWDGSPTAVVSLAYPWPEQLARALARAMGLGDRDVCWQNWPDESAGGTCYYEPSEADVAARPYVLASLSLQSTVPSAALPDPLFGSPPANPRRVSHGCHTPAGTVGE